MPTYVLLTTLTAEGGHTLHAHPERMLEVNREISEFGCKVLRCWARTISSPSSTRPTMRPSLTFP